jgi:transcriptional regulator with XRE-family HTH domain
MKDRLNKLIVSEGLTPALLADELDLQRSTLSHVLNGRNNPGYDFIRKLLIRFPKLNAEWLILGKGNMYHHQPHGSLSDLFSPPHGMKPAPFPPPAPLPVTPPAPPEAKMPTAEQEDDKHQPPVRIPDLPASHGEQQKTVEQIIIMYADKTFSVYLPR